MAKDLFNSFYWMNLSTLLLLVLVFVGCLSLHHQQGGENSNSAAELERLTNQQQ